MYIESTMGRVSGAVKYNEHARKQRSVCGVQSINQGQLWGYRGALIVMQDACCIHRLSGDTSW